MKPNDELLYEYSLIRFVPCIERGEFLNIGLIMMNKRLKWFKCRIELNETRLENCFPGYNKELLKSQSSLFENRNVPFPDLPVEEKYRWLTAVKSASLQVSPSHPGIIHCDNPDRNDTLDSINLMESEFQRLLKRLVL